MDESGSQRETRLPERIVARLNAVLFYKQMTAEVWLQSSTLQVRLVAEPPADWSGAAILIDRELMRLRLGEVSLVQVEGVEPGSQEPVWQDEFALGDRASTLVPPRQNPPPSNSPSSPPRSPQREGLQAVLLGLGLAIALFVLSPLKLLFRGFLVLVHEVGHALTYWLFGYPAIPSVDLAFGGGVTLVLDQMPVLLGLIYLGLGALFYLGRFYPRLQGLVFLGAILYSICLFTPLHKLLSIGMGHGMEAIAIFVCLYFCISGRFCKFSGDRTIYGMLGFFTLFSDLEFSWKLLQDPDFRDWYEAGKGGVMDNDFMILATEYFHVNLSEIATGFLFLCLGAAIAAFLLFRYERNCLSILKTLLESA